MAGTQVRFSDGMDWLTHKPLARGDNSSIPFFGDVSGETPALPWQNPETRRRDVGAQKYASGTPTLPIAHTDRHGLLTKPRHQETEIFPTSHGNLKLTSSDQSRGFMPTADAVLFLRSEYLGSRFRTPPTRYYPTAWR